MKLTLTHPIKLLLCDVDGTLVDDNSVLNPETAAAFAEAYDNGIVATIATGRGYPMAQHLAHLLSIKGPVITCNGAQIIDSRTGKPMYVETMPEDDLIEALELCKSLEISYCAIGYDAYIFLPGDGPRIKMYRRLQDLALADGVTLREPEFFGDSFESLKGRCISKILVDDDTGVGCEKIRLAIQDHPSFDSYYSSPRLYEIMPKGTDKGTGAAKTAELMGLLPENMAVMGDYLNDLPMFEKAGLPIAMANGHEQAKAAAKYICESNNDLGVAKTIRRLIEENKRLGYGK